VRSEHPAYKELIESWRACMCQDGVYVHPDDAALLSDVDQFYRFNGFESFIESTAFGRRSDGGVHLGLVPRPYYGDVSRASVFLLMLNPGFIPLNYYAEETCREFRDALVGTLRQEAFDPSYPFLDLNPRWSWASTYWRRKLADIVDACRTKQRVSHADALAFLAREVCPLQLFPYHSARFSIPKKLARRLGSAKLMVKFVREALLPEAKADKVLLIVTRQAEEWGLNSQRNIVVYQGFETRAAHLTRNSRGGREIVRFLSLQAEQQHRADA